MLNPLDYVITEKIFYYAVPFTKINGCGVDKKPLALAGVYAPCVS